MDERAAWAGLVARALSAGLRVIEGAAFEAPVVAVQGCGAIGLGRGLGDGCRWAILAMALARHRADPAWADVFLAGRDGGRWLVSGEVVPLRDLGARVA